jgi:hypothetical protein
MSAFPQYGNIYPEVQNTIKNRGGNQLAVSQLKPWIRIASGYSNGLVLGSNLKFDSFDKRYGNESRAGRIGLNFDGHSVFEEKGPFARGYRPSPTIDAISIENGSEGLSRKLTTQIKCYSLSQLDTITRYFLEPRFYVLAEWGWNTNEVINSMAKLKGGAEAAVCEMVSYVNLSTMKDKRKNSKGHYDAFLGVITGGGVTYGDDETYIVDVEVTTQGEIPAYLQQHKGTVKGIKTNGNGNDSSLTFDVDEIEAAEKASLLGKALFMYMFNDLPGAKQIQKVKDLMTQEKWLAEYNYINMNGNVKDKLLETLKDVDVNVEDAEDDARVPTSQPLISEERFIRVELAWEILNSIDADLLPKPIQCGGNPDRKSLDFRINIDNTICRAHKHMFSIDKTTLYVPNKLGPDFGLRAVLGSNKPLKGSFLQIENGGLVTQNFAPAGLPDDKNFPQPVKLDIPGGSTYDDSLHKIQTDEYEWGYLKDLYINFDFFCTTMEKTGAVSKDVAIELLNGLASGVNLFWNFQLVNDGSKGKDDNGNEILQVVDTSFNGKPPTSASELARFQAIGENSPFLEFQIKLEIAGAMANQVMAQQMTDESSLNVEDKVEQFTGLFANAPDPVAKKLHQLHREEYAEEEKKKSAEREASREEVEKGKEEAWAKTQNSGTMTETLAMGAQRIKDKFNTGIVAGVKAVLEVGAEVVKDVGQGAADIGNKIVGNDTEAEGKDRESNFDLFMQKAGVFPKLNDPENMPDLANEWYDIIKSNDATLDDKTLICATWADSQLLRQIYEYDLNPTNAKLGAEKSAAKNPGYLPIEVTFKIHGVSGIKVGDVLRITDLPHVYRRKMLQVFNVSNTIDDDLWTTEVTAKLRNVDLA